MAASFMASHAVCSDFIVKSCHDDVAGNDSNFFRRLKILTHPRRAEKAFRQEATGRGGKAEGKKV